MAEATPSPLGNPAELVSFTGSIARVYFRDDESGYAIFRVNLDPGKLNLPDLTVKGATLANEGDQVSIVGTWKQDPKYGKQVEARSIVAVRPTSPAAIVRYLSSGIIRGVRETLARRIVERFGEDTFAVLDHEPDKLLSIHGLGAAKLARIKAEWALQKTTQDIMVFLSNQGITQGTAIRIYKCYGTSAIETIRANPYRLAADVRGIGFKKADEIAKNLGVPHDSPQRIEAGVIYALDDATGKKGQCGMTRRDLDQQAAQLLGLTEQPIGPIVESMLQAAEPAFVAEASPTGVPCIFQRNLYEAERSATHRLLAMTRRPSPWLAGDEERVEDLIDAVAEHHHMQLEPEQRQAVANGLTRRVSVLTGGPGTGKTSTLKVLLAALDERGLHTVLGAPTGKAAKRMREATAHPAATVARLIGMGQAERRQIECDVLVLDEVSMVDVRMLRDVLRALPDRACLVLVGDTDQLPSIGPGRVLGDIIDSGAIPVTHLTRVFRQAAQSAIVRNAHRICAGAWIETEPPPNAPPPDFHFIPLEDPEAIRDMVVKLVTHHIPERCGIQPHEIQVLSPMRRTTTGVNELNTALQSALNPNPDAWINVAGTRMGIGDRIVQTVNNYNINMMNGENAVIREVNREDATITVESDDGNAVTYERTDFDEVELAYAMTVHKSQGSQFRAVVLPVSTQHYMMLVRPIIYTAITRATDFCVVVGDPKAFAMAIRNDRVMRRLTRLEWLLESGSATEEGLFS